MSSKAMTQENLPVDLAPYDEAESLLIRARAIFDQLGQQWLGARTLVGSALSCLERLRPREATNYPEEARSNS